MEGIFLQSYSPESQSDDALSLWQAEKVAEKLALTWLTVLSGAAPKQWLSVWLAKAVLYRGFE